MAKKAKKKKKPAKKTTRKKSKKSTRKPRKPKQLFLGLHGKKLQILRAVPIMPCSAISKDRQGLMYAHTQATDVCKIYREQCQKRGLTIRGISGKTTDAHRPKLVKVGTEWEIKAVPCVRYEGVWEIRDIETGETETFPGSGDGDNEIWSNTSAQTIAFKQGVLMYFFTAWPQPIDWVKVVREELAKQKGENFVKALTQIMPPAALKILTATQAIKELTDFYGREIKPKKSREKS